MEKAYATQNHVVKPASLNSCKPDNSKCYLADSWCTFTSLVSNTAIPPKRPKFTCHREIRAISHRLICNREAVSITITTDNTLTTGCICAAVQKKRNQSPWYPRDICVMLSHNAVLWLLVTSHKLCGEFARPQGSGFSDLPCLNFSWTACSVALLMFTMTNVFCNRTDKSRSVTPNTKDTNLTVYITI